MSKFYSPVPIGSMQLRTRLSFKGRLRNSNEGNINVDQWAFLHRPSDDVIELRAPSHNEDTT